MKNLLIIDLESTCYQREQEPNNFFSEIIEIGAVVLDKETLEGIEEYQCFVKPVLFPQLSNFCKELTTITQEQVDYGIPLSQALEEIGSLARKHDALFCSWGFYDRQQFKRVCERFGLVYPFRKEHVSLKHVHSEFYQLPRKLGMEQALRHHQIPLKGIHHRGIDDARNIAKIARQMIIEGWKI